MSRLNTLLHGSASDAADILGGDSPPETNAELRAALTNALNRIDRLEQQSHHYRCGDCGSLAVEDDAGTTCRHCGRGVIS